jgi:hypothetical protein
VVLSWKLRQRRAPSGRMRSQALRALRPPVASVGGAGSAIAATRHMSCRAGCSIPSGPRHQHCASWSVYRCWVRHGARTLVHRVGRGDPLERGQCARRPLTGRGYFSAICAMTGVADALMASGSPSDDAGGRRSEQPSGQRQPREQTQGFRRALCRDDLSNLAPVNEHRPLGGPS